MALKLEVDSLDSVPEALRAEYAADGAKFRLKVDGIEDTSGLKTALQKERTERQAKEKTVKQWEKFGKTPEEIEALLDAQAKLDEDKATKAGEWDKLRAQMNTKHAEEIKARDDKLAAKDKSLHRFLIDSQATAALAAAKGVPDLLLPHVQRHVRVAENNGEFTVQVVNAAGEPRVNGKGEPLSISDLVSEMKQSEIFGRAFDGSGQSGSGTQPANGSGGTPNVKTKADLMKGATSKTAQRKIRAQFVEANGGKYEAYAALPDGGFAEAKT